MYKITMFDGTSYRVWEETLEKARAKLARAFVQIGADQYIWKDKGSSFPPIGSIKVSENIYLRKHNVEEIPD